MSSSRYDTLDSDKAWIADITHLDSGLIAGYDAPTIGIVLHEQQRVKLSKLDKTQDEKSRLQPLGFSEQDEIKLGN